MKKILSILLTVTMLFSLVAAFRAPTAKAGVQNGITITTPTNLSTIYTTTLDLVGTYAFSVGAGYDLYLTVTANGITTHYAVLNTGTTAWSKSINSGDFLLAVDGGHSYPTTVEGILVVHSTTTQVGTFDTGPVTYTWIPNGITNQAFVDTDLDGVWDITELNHSSSIQTVINAAVAGETIIVTPGTYNENVTVNKALTLIGAGSGCASLYGSLSRLAPSMCTTFHDGSPTMHLY